MCVLDFVAKSGHQSDKSVLSLMSVFYCMCVRLCYILRASVGLCLILRVSLVLIYSLFCFSVTHLCETMISPSSRSIFLPTDILRTVCLVVAKPTPHTKMWFTCAGTYFTVLAYHVILHKNQHVRVCSVGLFAVTLSVYCLSP